MTGITTWRRIGVLLFAFSLLAAGCRANNEASTGDDQTTEASEADTSEEPSASEEDTAEASEDDTAAAGDVEFDVGVTEEPCPEPVNEDNGCIYLGTISDLTQGPFASLGQSIVESQAAFWRTVNEEGGIGGFDVDVTTYVRDSFYIPERHNQVYLEIKPNILAIAQTLGSPGTAAILPDLKAEGIVSAPATWSSGWAFEPAIVESGANYCIESMNSIDYALENFDPAPTKVMAVHYPGEYGEDGAAGARIGAEENGLEFVDVETPTGADNQAGAIDALVSQAPDLVIITTGPADAAAIVGQAAAQGFTGRVIGTSPTWNPGLNESPAAQALQQLYIQSSPWATYTTDTPGHQAMREAIGREDGDDGLTSGWAWSYPLRAALEAAAEAGDLTRAGLLEAASNLEEVDYQGMLPEGAGNYAAEPNEGAVRANVFQEPDPESPTGVSLITEEFYTGPTAEAFELTEPCFLLDA